MKTSEKVAGQLTLISLGLVVIPILCMLIFNLSQNFRGFFGTLAIISLLNLVKNFIEWSYEKPWGMKNLVIIIGIFALTLNVNAQETKDSTKVEKEEWWEGLSATFVTGETALTCGNTLFLTWKKGKSVFIADFNDDLGEFMYLYYPKSWFSIGPSVGFLWGKPYAGPVGTIEFGNRDKFYFNSLHWFGWNFGNALNECTFLFSYHQFNFGYTFGKKFGAEAYYILQHFEKNIPEHIPGAKLTYNLSKSWSVFVGWGYMVHKDYHLWSCGANINL